MTQANFSARSVGQPTPRNHLPSASSAGRAEKSKKNLFDIVPPHDETIERAAIGSMLCVGFAAEYCAEILTPDAFYAPRNRWLFSKCCGVLKLRKALDEQILVADLRPPMNTDDIKDYIGRLIIEAPSGANIEGYCSKLLSLRHDRQKLDFALRIITEIQKK